MTGNVRGLGIRRDVSIFIYHSAHTDLTSNGNSSSNPRILLQPFLIEFQTQTNSSVGLFVRTLGVARGQFGVAAATHAFKTDSAPKMFMLSHSKSAAALFPSTRDAAVVDSMSAINAPISKTLPRFRDEVTDARDVSLAMLDFARGESAEKMPL